MEGIKNAGRKLKRPVCFFGIVLQTDLNFVDESKLGIPDCNKGAGTLRIHQYNLQDCLLGKKRPLAKQAL